MTKSERAALERAIEKVIGLELKIERTYTDLQRTREQEEERRIDFEWQLGTARHELNQLIGAL